MLIAVLLNADVDSYTVDRYTIDRYADRYTVDSNADRYAFNSYALDSYDVGRCTSKDVLSTYVDRNC